jgi:hypothetical protein
MYVHAGSLKNMGGKGSGLTAQVVGVNASRAWIRLAAGPQNVSPSAHGGGSDVVYTPPTCRTYTDANGGFAFLHFML